MYGEKVHFKEHLSSLKSNLSNHADSLMFSQVQPPAASLAYVTLQSHLLHHSRASVQGSWPLWISTYTVTAMGRCLADAHWLSDCLAGMLLSTALVSLTAILAKPAIQRVRDKEADELRGETSGK